MRVTPQFNQAVATREQSMLVRSLRKHYDTEYREEGEEFEHSGPLYEHIVPVKDPAEAQEQGAPASQQKPAKRR